MFLVCNICAVYNIYSYFCLLFVYLNFIIGYLDLVLNNLPPTFQLFFVQLRLKITVKYTCYYSNYVVFLLLALTRKSVEK